MSEQLQIRSYEARDRAQLVRLWTTVFPDDPPRNAPELMIDAKLRVGDGLLLVANLGETLVGAIIGGYDGVRGWIYHLAVDPAQRRRGYATLLVREVERRLEELGCLKVNLQIRSTNSAVARLYAALGYEVEERVSMGRVI